MREIREMFRLSRVSPSADLNCGGAITSVPGNNGNVLAQTINGAGRLYSYDGANRLCRSGQGATWTESYAYDARGNIGVTRSGALPAVTAEVIGSTAAYGTNNRVSSWAYDLSGNVAGIPAAGGSTTRAPCASTVQAGTAMLRTACYDAENRMYSETDASGATSTYAYDGDGRRVKKTVSGLDTVFVYDPYGRMAQEYGGPPIPPTESGTRYLTTDHLGSTRIVTKPDGTAAQTYDYLAFGQDFTVPTDSNRIRFTSKERDAETGLDWFLARYDSSSQGRFTSPDPLLTSADPTNPQSWNRYSYGLNNPLRYVDPTGLVAISVDDCQKDSSCTVVKVNLIYDKNANIYDRNGNVRADVQKNIDSQIAKAADEYGNANVAFQVSTTSGTVDRQRDGSFNVTGTVEGALNVAVTDANGLNTTSTGGISFTDRMGRSDTLINGNRSQEDTISHEFAHHFTGDTRMGLAASILYGMTGLADINNDSGRALMRNWNTPAIRVIRVIDPLLDQRMKQGVQDARQRYGLGR